METETEFTIPRRSAVLVHGMKRFVAVSDEHDLFHTVIDDEQVTDLLIVDLTCLAIVFAAKGFRVLTCNMRMTVSKFASGSCLEVSVGRLVTMLTAPRLEDW